MVIAEQSAVARLPGGPIPYTLRRSTRARTLRVVIDPKRGVVVTIPAGGRRDRPDAAVRIEAFLAERERWLRRHLGRQAAARAELSARGGLADGARIRFRGELHRLRVGPAEPGRRRSTVDFVPGEEEPILAVHLADADRRTVARLLEVWFQARARIAIDRAIARHADAMGVTPTAISLRDPRSRWGSASRTGRLSFSWRLVLGPPEALETVVVHELAHLRVFGHSPRFWAVVAARRPDHVTWRHWLRDHSLELHGALDG
jgi:predicted metal-dependent hydrolase